MRDPAPSTTSITAHPTDLLLDAPAVGRPTGGPLDGVDAAPPAANRAARRGRAGRKAPSGAVHGGSAGTARAAQGRRINPVRRSG